MITLSDLFQTNKKQDPLTWYKKQKSLTWYEIKIMESFNRKSPLADEFANAIDISNPTSFAEYAGLFPSSRGDIIFLYHRIAARLYYGLPIVAWDNQIETSTGKVSEYCSACLYYEGNYLHCSVHPNGIDDELSCPDFIRKSDKVLLDEENTFSSLLKMLDR